MEPIASLRGRSLLTLDDVTDAEMQELVLLAEALKAKKARRDPAAPKLLAGRNIALVFEKASTRTRCATQVAVADEGGHAEYLGKNDIHFGKKESIADSARVLGRMFDGILFRGFAHETVTQLARQAGVPVWNGLTDAAHPTQILADLQTMRQGFGPELRGLKVVYIGDGRNNVALSLMHGCAKAGIHVVDCCPESLAPDPASLAELAALARRNGSTVAVEPDPAKAVAGANVLYTDVWVSMGEEAKFAERLQLLRPYQVTMALVRRTGNLENGRILFLHCLPAFHNFDTDVTTELGALEVTDEVFEAPFSRVFDQAENRMHTIKAMIVSSLAG
ncbi:MAG: ornithine carbamoyltransferase [Lentisphaeria bacterium]|jgi:ornithine carbamoyltransferase